MNLKYEYFKTTRSVCPECKITIPAKLVFYNDAVYMLKTCRTHGEFFTLIYSDRQKYIDSLRINKPALYPVKVFNNDFRGCPSSCGLCPEHQQHTCLPIIEITDHCNMACPICLVDTSNSWHMPVKKFEKIIKNMIKAEGSLDFVNIGGGEPTLHPELIDIVDTARRREIINITISTNGRAFLKNTDLLSKLIDRNVFFALQFDGFDHQAYIKLRGQDIVDEKLRILELLEKFSARTSLVMTVMNGVNRKEIGNVIKYFFQKEFIKYLMFQPIVFTNPSFKYDASKVITIPDIASEIAAGSGGTILESDIISMPCAHPVCVSITHLLKLDNGKYIPISRFVEVDNYLDTIKNRVTPGMEIESYEKIKESIYDLWSLTTIQPQSREVLDTIKDIISEIGCCGPGTKPRQLFEIAEKNIKSIFIHHFMDAYNLDFSRIMKCCHHYPLDENRLIPCCVYNNMERER
jgi:uncharacterized radical SAM superfamily Fe-S cluster-containing enzyme